MELGEARKFSEPFSIVTERVKPYRDTLTRQVHESRYWLYWDKREKFFASVEQRDRILVCPVVTKYLSFRFFPPTWVFSHQLKVFDIATYDLFAILQSSVHDVWARKYSSTLGQTLRYSTSDAFDTFPLAAAKLGNPELTKAGSEYYEAREAALDSLSVGLTDFYNMLHDPKCKLPYIVKSRTLRVALDAASLLAFGWNDIATDHDFVRTAQGLRFDVSERLRSAVLERLLEANHQLAKTEEMTKTPTAPTSRKKTRATKGGTTLFD